MLTVGMANSPLRIARGEVPDAQVRHLAGRHQVSKTTWEPICYGGNYRMPAFGTAVPLRVKGGDVQDSPSGTGARKVRLNCLDVDGNPFTEVLETGGTGSGPETQTPVWRLLHFDVVEVGARGETVGAAPSSAGDIVIEDGSANEWGRIEAGHGDASMGMTTLPRNWHGRIVQMSVGGDKERMTRTAIYYRENTLTAGPPWDSEQHIFAQNAEDGKTHFALEYPSIPAKPLSDIGIIGKTDSQTNEITIILELVMEKRK